MAEYLTQLNDAQQKAVVDTEGPSVVIAGAGSGKTRVLTYRIAHLLNKGVSPFKILALTFTNKAAKEMKERIAAIVGDAKAKDIWMGTFHSVFSRILRREAECLGYTKNFTIYDTVDSKNQIKAIIKELHLDDKTYKPNQVFGRISFAKNSLITAQAYYGNNQLIAADNASKRPRIADIYKLYAQRCKKADAMDFDDLLLNTNILFRDYPDLLEKYQGYFKYILVDEYQDTNYAQYLIVKKLAAQFNNVCVVGDDAQSIYSFRGAMVENILNFKRDYPECKMHKLEQNYRSTKVIVNAANSVIKKNDKQIEKHLFSDNDKGDKIRVLHNRTDNQEGFTVAALINNKIDRGGAYKEHAILYRTNAQSRIFEEVFRNQQIPYRIYGSLSFYQRKEIKDVLAYFRLIINKKDEEAIKRIINYPARGIGATTLNKLMNYSNDKMVPVWDVLTYPDQHPLGLNGGTLNKLKGFVDLIRVLTEKAQHTDVYEIASFVINQTGIIKELDYKENPENLQRYENVQELLSSISEFAENHREEGQILSLDAYMENVALLTGEENNDEEDDDRVSMMTIHSAKGLEFDHIYVVGVEENLFPSSMTTFSEKDLEEERRLFYVALTRARKSITISYAIERFKWGNTTSVTPSRFIKDIDPDYLILPEELFDEHVGMVKKEVNTMTSGLAKQAMGAKQNKGQAYLDGVKPKMTPPANSDEEFVPDDPEKIQSGMDVKHKRFGSGKVLNIEGKMPNRKATVFFKEHGQKQLLLKFAKLKIIQNN